MMTKSSGQALLIVLLVMAVVLTIALSVVSRSVTDISISKKEEDASRAFSAAEAGIERTLTSGVAITSPDQLNSGGRILRTQVTELATGGRDFDLPILLAAGEAAPVWLVSHNTSGALVCDSSNPCYTGSTIKVCWGELGSEEDMAGTTPAFELSVIYLTGDDYSSARIARAAYDPYTTRQDSNSFTEGSDGTCAVSGTNFAFSKNIDLSTLGVTARSSSSQVAGPQMIRAKLLYNTDKAHGVGVQLTDTATLPRQGLVIESTGQADIATRKIQVYQLYPDLPPVFDYSAFAGAGGLVKNNP